MTLAPFAALESRLNSAVVQRLANATAVYKGGAPFGVLFERTPADPFGGAASAAQPACGFMLASAPDLCEGEVLMIDGTPYVVASGVQPDAGGWVNLNLYPQA
jgi:hypothetical protein